MNVAGIVVVATVAAVAGVAVVAAIHVAVNRMLVRVLSEAATAAAETQRKLARYTQREPKAGLDPVGQRLPSDPRVAGPGDPRLDIDLYNVELSDVVSVGADFIVEGVGSDGAFVPVDGWRMEPVTTVELRVMFGIPSAPDWQVAYYQGVLARWRDGAVPLRLVGAPGRLTMLWDPDPGGAVLVIPRSA